MNVVIDRHGNRKNVPSGYVLQDGERCAVGVMTMDGKSSTAIHLQDQQVAVGDVVFVDEVQGLTRYRFQDGTAAIVRPDGGISYVNSVGQQVALSREQMAFDAKRRGKFPEWIRDYVEREADVIAAREKMKSYLSNAWRR